MISLRTASLFYDKSSSFMENTSFLVCYCFATFVLTIMKNMNSLFRSLFLLSVLIHVLSIKSYGPSLRSGPYAAAQHPERCFRGALPHADDVGCAAVFVGIVRTPAKMMWRPLKEVFRIRKGRRMAIRYPPSAGSPRPWM